MTKKFKDEQVLTDIIWSYEEVVMLLKAVLQGNNTPQQAVKLCNEYLKEELKSALITADYL